MFQIINLSRDHVLYLSFVAKNILVLYENINTYLMDLANLPMQLLIAHHFFKSKSSWSIKMSIDDLVPWYCVWSKNDIHLFYLERLPIFNIFVNIFSSWKWSCTNSSASLSNAVRRDFKLLGLLFKAVVC